MPATCSSVNPLSIKKFHTTVLMNNSVESSSSPSAEKLLVLGGASIALSENI
jgi:hypothetical protein